MRREWTIYGATGGIPPPSVLALRQAPAAVPVCGGAHCVPRRGGRSAGAVQKAGGRKASPLKALLRTEGLPAAIVQLPRGVPATCGTAGRRDGRVRGRKARGGRALAGTGRPLGSLPLCRVPLPPGRGGRGPSVARRGCAGGKAPWRGRRRLGRGWRLGHREGPLAWCQWPLGSRFRSGSLLLNVAAYSAAARLAW